MTLIALFKYGNETVRATYNLNSFMRAVLNFDLQSTVEKYRLDLYITKSLYQAEADSCLDSDVKVIGCVLRISL